MDRVDFSSVRTDKRLWMGPLCQWPWQEVCLVSVRQWGCTCDYSGLRKQCEVAPWAALDTLFKGSFAVKGDRKVEQWVKGKGPNGMCVLHVEDLGTGLYMKGNVARGRQKWLVQGRWR